MIRPHTTRCKDCASTAQALRKQHSQWESLLPGYFNMGMSSVLRRSCLPKRSSENWSHIMLWSIGALLLYQPTNPIAAEQIHR